MIFIGTWLKTERERLGFTQVELAARAGVSLPTIQNLETGKGNPSLSILELLAGALEFTFKFELAPPDWKLLVHHGLPIQEFSHNVKNTLRSPDILVYQIKIAARFLQSNIEPNMSRYEEALCALLFALKTHYPSFFKRHLSSILILQSYIKKTIDGKIIKLSRIARSILGLYL